MKHHTQSLRTAESICFLCKQNKATKENSHIIPKFMGKSILGENNAKRCYLLGSDRAHKAPEFSQDTDKEDFILCVSCEKYFSVLETYIANKLHNRLWDNDFVEQFPTFKSQGGITWRVCEQINPIIFRLFLYSIIWRCSISSTQLCNDFSLSIEEEETLRKTLFSYKFEKQTDLLNNINKPDSAFPNLSFIFFTADSFENKTENFIFINPLTENPYQLVLNEYILIFSFSLNGINQTFKFLNNFDNSNIKVGFFQKEYWNRIRQGIIDIVADKTVKKMKESGEKPWRLKMD